MPKPKNNDIPIALLRECFDLDVETGALTWRVRPREHFATANAWASWNAIYPGEKAGTLHPTGYLNIGLTIDRRCRLLLGHRVIFALVHGRWPVDEIDHRNGVEAGDDVDNLREATHAQNCQNRKVNGNNTTGFPGVSKHGNKWQANIAVAGRRRHLGAFDTAEAAHAVRLKAKAELHPFQPVPR